MTRLSACFPFVKKPQKGNAEVTLAILGLDNAGKTTTTRILQGEDIAGVTPTVGFEKLQFSVDKFNINLYDLGGGKTIRDIWKNYFSEVYGIIYVVDSSDVTRLSECKQVLADLLSHSKIKGKPILLLANKQDQENAMDEGDIIEELKVGQLANENRCPCRLELCSAAFEQGRKLDPSIKKGLKWLLSFISANIDNLAERINADMSADRNEQEEERAKRRERVRLIREERERDKKRRGEVSDEEDDEVARDPFKRLDPKSFDSKGQTKDKQLDSKTKSSSRPFDSKPLHSGYGGGSKLDQRSESPPLRRSDDDLYSGSRFDRKNDRGDIDRELAGLRTNKKGPQVQNSKTDDDAWKYGKSSSVSRNPFITETFDSSRNRAAPNSRLDPLHSDNSRTASSSSKTNQFKKRAEFEEDDFDSKQRNSNLKKKTNIRKNKLAPEDSDYEEERGYSQSNSRLRGNQHLNPSHPHLFVTERIMGMDDL